MVGWKRVQVKKMDKKHQCINSTFQPKTSAATQHFDYSLSDQHNAILDQRPVKYLLRKKRRNAVIAYNTEVGHLCVTFTFPLGHREGWICIVNHVSCLLWYMLQLKAASSAVAAQTQVCTIAALSCAHVCALVVIRLAVTHSISMAAPPITCSSCVCAESVLNSYGVMVTHLS